MSDDLDDFEPSNERERHVLLIVLLLNAGLSIGLGTAGVAGDSSGLIANALDNASDAVVYGISYFAVGRGPAWKTRAARLSGIMLLLLAAGVLADVFRRFTEGAEPAGVVMIVATIIAVIVNGICLRMLQAIRRKDVNLRAAWTFSANDLFSNLGVLLAGVLVAWLGSSLPDLIVGVVIALVAAWGGIEILRDAGRQA